MERFLRLLADPTRLRILAAVDPEELAVNEIADVLGMSQPRISNHLRLLRDAGALQGRREGHWTFYRNALAPPGHGPGSELWRVVREGLDGDRRLRADGARRDEILRRRRMRSRAHFAGRNHEAELEHLSLREEMLGCLVPTERLVVDAGCGDGYLTELLADRFAGVLAFDHTPERLAAARKRTGASPARFVQAEVDALPLPSAVCDAVFFSLVLHHVPRIAPALREAARILRPEGDLVVADLAPHEDESMRRRRGDLHLGLDADMLASSLEQAGFEKIRLRPARDRVLAAGGKKLDLFLATARRPRVRPRGKKAGPRAGGSAS